MDEIINWLFVESIYGIVIVCSSIYGIANYIIKFLPKNFISKIPDLTPVFGIFFLLYIATMPTYPRHKFHNEALQVLDKLPPYAKVINKTYWGDIIEPITWFKDFIGSLYIVSPNDPITSGFKTILLRFEEKPRITIVDADCGGKTWSESEPDNNGVYRYTTQNEKISDFHFQIFCKEDWTKEKEILRTEMIKAYSKKEMSSVVENEMEKQN